MKHLELGFYGDRKEGVKVWDSVISESKNAMTMLKIGLCCILCFLAGALSSNAASVGNWKLEDSSGTTAADSSGSGNSLTLVANSFPGGTGKRGNALSFSNSYMYKNSFSLGTSDFTLATWFKTSSTSDQGIFDLYSSGITERISLRILTNGMPYFATYANSTTCSTQAGPVITDGEWHHIAASCDRDGLATLYIDGHTCGTLDISSHSTADFSGTLRVGLASGNYFSGMLDEVQIYNNVLTPDEIFNLATAVGNWKLEDTSGTVAADSSGSGNSLTLVGNSFPGVTGKRSNALSFSNSYTYRNGFSLNTSDFTLAAWVKTSSSATQGIFDLFSSGVTSRAFLSILNGKAYYGTYSSSTTYSANAGPVITDGEWHHVAVTFDRDAFATLYVDGFAQNANSAYIANHSNVDLSGTLRVGLFAGYYFDGLIDEARIYDKVLSPDEVFDLAALAHWNLDEKAGESGIKDFTGNGYDGILWDMVNSQVLTVDSSDTTTDAIADTAMILNGKGQYVITNDINVGTEDISISAWFKTTDTMPIFQLTDDSGDTRLRCLIDGSGYIQYGLYKSSWILATGTKKVDDGKWHHVAVTYDRNGDSTLYVDGVKDTGNPLDISSTSAGIINGDFRIGYVNNYIDTSLAGKFDEVYVFDRVITEDEVESLVSIPAVKKLISDDSDPRGVVKRPTQFNLNKAGAWWQHDSVIMEFDPQSTAYRAVFGWSGDAGSSFWRLPYSKNLDITMLPNREYIVSALIKTNFPRMPLAGQSNEIDIVPILFDSNDNKLVPRYLGVPADSSVANELTASDVIGGWQRWEATVTSDYIVDSCSCGIGIYFIMSVPAGGTQYDFRIADLALIEKPAKTLVPYTQNNGVTFQGEAGNLPMGIVANVTETQENRIRVVTTGARYYIDLSTSKIYAEQRLEFKRPIAEYQFPTNSLSGLTITSSTSSGTVLSNTNLTIGIQPDSLMVITPHQGYGNLDVTVTSEVPSPNYSRLYSDLGVLFSKDEYGGFAVYPDPGMDSGETPDYTALTPVPDFVSFDRDNTQTLSTSAAGWKIKWTTKPGQRLCIAVFPGKEYDWADSFYYKWYNAYPATPLSSYGSSITNTRVLWTFFGDIGGFSYGPLQEVFDADTVDDHVDAIHAANRSVVVYTSASMFYNRDAEEWIENVSALKNDYGFDGIYTDGVPKLEFLVGYEEMRMARELFPSGKIIIHDSSKPDSLPAPFINAYATSLLSLESVPSTDGPDWNYARYTGNGYRTSNSIGALKGQLWTGFVDADNPANGITDEKAMWQLLFNGRSRLGILYAEYRDTLTALETDWETYGSEQDYYDKYYIAKAREESGLNYGRTAMPLVSRTVGDPNDTVVLSCKDTVNTVIRYTTDGTEPTSSSTAYSSTLSVLHKTKIKAKAFKTGLDSSRTAVSRGLIVEKDAEYYNDQSGINSGGGYVYNIDNNDWILFNSVALGGGVDMIAVDVRRLSTSKLGGDIEVWVTTTNDFSYIGSVAIPDTFTHGGWWTVTAPITFISGNKHIKLVFRGGGADGTDDMFELDNVRFYASGD